MHSRTVTCSLNELQSEQLSLIINDSRMKNLLIDTEVTIPIQNDQLVMDT